MNIFFGGRGWGGGLWMGYDETVDILGGYRKTELFWELFLNILGFFSRLRYKIGIFLGIAILQ